MLFILVLLFVVAPASPVNLRFTTSDYVSPFWKRNGFIDKHLLSGDESLKHSVTVSPSSSPTLYYSNREEWVGVTHLYQPLQTEYTLSFQNFFTTIGLRKDFYRHGFFSKKLLKEKFYEVPFYSYTLRLSLPELSFGYFVPINDWLAVSSCLGFRHNGFAGIETDQLQSFHSLFGVFDSRSPLKILGCGGLEVALPMLRGTKNSLLLSASYGTSFPYKESRNYLSFMKHLPLQVTPGYDGDIGIELKHTYSNIIFLLSLKEFFSSDPKVELLDRQYSSVNELSRSASEEMGMEKDSTEKFSLAITPTVPQVRYCTVLGASLSFEKPNSYSLGVSGGMILSGKGVPSESWGNITLSFSTSW